MIMELQHLEVQTNKKNDIIVNLDHWLGAHTPKPAMIQDVFDLLADRDALSLKIRQLQHSIEADTPCRV